MGRKKRNLWLFLLLCFGFLLISVTRALATTINVPGNYSTIQSAINAASPGDTVQVAAGIYEERIRLRSGVTVQGDPYETAIVGYTDSPIVTEKPIVKAENVGANTKIDGFLIMGGDAWPGGGIFCDNSSLIISNNIIALNNAQDIGGGIFCDGASPKIVNNIILLNSAHNNYGGGIAFRDSDPIIVNNTVTENEGGVV